jgi:hypothetical protein
LWQPTQYWSTNGAACWALAGDTQKTTTATDALQRDALKTVFL